MAHATWAGLYWTVDAITLLTAESGAIPSAEQRSAGDTERAVDLACRRESIDVVRSRLVGRMVDAGVDEQRAELWMSAPDPILGKLSPVYLIECGFMGAVDVALRYRLDSVDP